MCALGSQYNEGAMWEEVRVCSQRACRCIECFLFRVSLELVWTAQQRLLGTRARRFASRSWSSRVCRAQRGP